MLHKNHNISIIVNGKQVELGSQSQLNLRLNNVVYNPEKTTSTQAEYSYEFELPATPHNNKIFDYANNLSKLNKFHNKWNAEVYADGTLIFEGSLTISSFKDGKYTCNLVIIKIYSLENIFGNDTMNKINWKVPYEGFETMNAINGNADSKYYFPLVSYGVFEKDPYHSDEIANDYTSKFQFDEWNKWYYSSFYPSLNMLETLRKCFEYKGYNVGGTVFQDKYLNNIYMSTNLADGQVPEYNLGNPKFGKASISFSWSNGTVNGGNATNTYTGYEQDLDFPYMYVNNLRGHFGGSKDQIGTWTSEAWNFESVNIWNMLSSKNGGSAKKTEKTYLFDDGEGVIVIPTDGFYKIHLDCRVTLQSKFNGGNVTVNINQIDGTDIVEKDNVNIKQNLKENTPIEIQLVKNYDDDIELIKGKWNLDYLDGNPNNTTFQSQANRKEWLTCFPQEDLLGADSPTKTEGVVSKSINSGYGFKGSIVFPDGGGSNTGGTSSGTGGGTGGGTFSGGGHSFGGRRAKANIKTGLGSSTSGKQGDNIGYVYKDGEIMGYDPLVNENFICGASSFMKGTVSVIKNGYSWSKSNSTKNESFYPANGYQFVTNPNGEYSYSSTTYNENSYINCPSARILNGENTLDFSIDCCVYLYRNDILELMAVQRAFEGSIPYYYCSASGNLSIQAMSSRHYEILKANNFQYYSNTEFDTHLNLANFLSSSQNISEWVQGILNAYNLEMIQDGKNILINTQKMNMNDSKGVVSIDDRVNTSDIESEIIDYPKSMAVKYKIDTDEWGFEKTVPQTHINDDDWKDYGDSGFTTIQLSDRDDASTEEKSLPFSYTYYDYFTWYNVDENGKINKDDSMIMNIPIISKSTPMIESYSYDESMKGDGYGQPQRFWFRGSDTGKYVYSTSLPKEKMNLVLPKNIWDNLNLSYKNDERSILTEYFNIVPSLESNYINVDVYLTPNEYNMIKNGAYVNVDSDLYIVCEVDGYDPTGGNKTTLKLMKKS